MRLRRRGVILLAIAALALAGLLALVVLRGPIAQGATHRLLSWRGMDVALNVVALDFDRAVVEGVRLGPEDAPAIAARRIEARYSLIGLLRGRFRAVTAEGLEVRLTVDAQGARLDGFPAGEGGGGDRRTRSRRAPSVSIPDGRIYVATPAGEMIADLVVAGGPDEGWSAEAQAYPAVVGDETSTVELEAASANAEIANGELRIVGDVRLASVSVGGATVEGVSSDVSFRGRYEDMSQLAGLEGEGALGLGLGRARLDAATAAAWAERLAPRLQGGAGEAAGAHFDALRGMLADALQELSVDADFSLAAADGRIAAAPRDVPAVVAANGARLSMASASDVGGAIVVDSRAGTISMRDISLEAELGDVNARAIVNAGAARRERGALAGEATLTFALAPWEAGGLMLAADVQRARIERDEGRWRVVTEAELRAEGTRFGITADDLVLQLDAEATAEDGAFELRPRDDAIQRLEAVRVTAAGRTFESVAAQVQPLTNAGAIMRADAEGVSMETRWLDASAGLSGLGGRWVGLLPAAEFVARLDRAGGGEVLVYAQAPRFEGRLNRGRAIAQARVIDAGLTLGADSSARLRFEGLSLGGSALPVAVSQAAGEFEASLRDGKPYQGVVGLTGARIEDVEELDRVTVLTLSMEGGIEEGRLDATLAAIDEQARSVATGELRHAFETGAGALNVETPRFTFGRNFQPYDVMPVLRGPIVDVTGAASLDAELSWGGNGLAASGQGVLSSLAFGTRFGRIEGLSTRFEIADLLEFTTSEPQTIAIGLVDPGLPLENGTIEIELLGGTRARLAGGRFPFAQGEITARPAVLDWSVGEYDIVLEAHSISLNALDVQFDPPNLDMTGALSGQIPIEARGRGVFVVGGELVSDAPGRVSYTGRAGEGIAQQNESTKLAFDALTNFHYDRLVLELNGNVAGLLTVGVRLEGRNPNVLEGYPINFNLNTSAEFATLVTRGFSGLNLGAAMRTAREDQARAAEEGETAPEDGP